MPSLPPIFNKINNSRLNPARSINWPSYRPLLVMTAIAALASLALKVEEITHWQFVMQDFMHAFMGMMFLFFAMLKLFDLESFVTAFKKYDLFAQSSDRYAYAFPFIELFLGFAYLSYFIAPLTYLITIIVSAITGYSVILAIRRGLDVRCACLGTALNVPLSTVSIFESVAMGAMATFMLLRGGY